MASPPTRVLPLVLHQLYYRNIQKCYAHILASSATGDHHVKQDEPSSERQILHLFTHMQNLYLKIIITSHNYKKGTVEGKGKGKHNGG
jgi:hypothetical protein